MGEGDKKSVRKDGQDMKVIVKAKELTVQTFRLTINTNRYPKNVREVDCRDNERQ
jgi:hypothetical protein